MYKKLLRKINNLSELVMKFSDKELKNKTDELKKRISNNEKEIDIIAEENAGECFDLTLGLIVDILGSVIDLRSLKIRPSEILTP